jgi:O-antigen ligase/tetratricopeptide (TPR) repeat protein
VIGDSGSPIRYALGVDRPRALWYAFLAVWAFTLAAYGAVTVACTAAATAAMAVLNLAAARLLPEPLKLSRAAVAFLAASAGLFLLQFLPVAPLLFPVTQTWRATHGVGSLWPGTADTFRTVLALAQFALYVLSALLVVKLRQSGLGASTMLRSVVAVIALEAVYGLVQVFGGLRDIPFYGPRPSPDSASGTLVGRNNFAGLMAVGFVVALALGWGRFSWPVRRESDSGKPRWMRRIEGSALWALAAGLFAIALVLTHSRGGALAALGGAALLPLIYRGRGSLVGAAALALVAIGAVAIAGLQPLLERFGALDASDLASDARWTIFATTLAGAVRQPVLGFGFGTHPAAYHPFQPPAVPGQIHHAHNEYVNVFFEAGAVGLLLFVAALGFWFVRAWRAQRPLPGPDRLHVTAAIAAAAVTALHSFVDFDLRIPALGILFGAMVGVGAAASKSGLARPRLAWVPPAVALAAVAALFAGLDAVALTERARGSETAEMERLSTRALGLSPYEYRAAWARARAAQRRGDAAETDRRFEIASDLWPAHPGVQREAGLWFWELGAAGLDRAAKCFHRLFEQDPSQVGPLLGEIWAAAGRSPGDYDRLIPPLPAPTTAYASFLVREGEWARAVNVFDRGVPATASNAPYYDGLAAALDAAGQWGVEATILDRRLEVKSNAAAYAASARAWLKLGALDRALERATLACRIDLANAAWQALRGDILCAKGDRLSAVEAYSEAISRSPMALAYREARGWAYLELRMFDLAAEEFKTSLRSKPLERSLVAGLARSLVGLGQASSARLLLDEFLRKCPGDVEMHSFRDTLPR